MSKKLDPEKKRKKRGQRKKIKNPALDPNYTTKVRREFLDFDYIDKLSEKDKAFLNKFVEEELNAAFKKRGNLNKTKDDKKRAYTNNNKRNNDVYGVNKAQGRLLLQGEMTVLIDENNPANPESYEDDLIDFIDNGRNED